MSEANKVVRLRSASRPVWRTLKIRAGDLLEGDVTRNKYGKWARVRGPVVPDDLYVHVPFDSGDVSTFRDVALVDVQVAKDL